MGRFFSFDARITRTRLITGLVLALVLAWLGILAVRSGPSYLAVLVGAIGGAVFAKLLVESVRRRHDMGRGGAPAVALAAGGVTIMAAALLYALGTGAFFVFHGACLLLAVGWATLLMPAGVMAPNPFGLPAQNRLVPTFGEARVVPGALFAMILTVLGASLGYAGARWEMGLRERHMADQRYADTMTTDGNGSAPDALELDYRTHGGR